MSKSRLAPSPAFGCQQQLQTQQNQFNNQRLRESTQSSVGPMSVSSSRGASPAPSTPMVTSPPTAASLGKGMSSSERAALNAPRTSSLSSQIAAITAAQDRDEDSPPSTSGAAVKGKLDMKHEDIEIKRERDDGDSSNHVEGGKSMGNDIKSECKIEPMDESEIKEEPHIKEEPRTPMSSSSANDAAGPDIKYPTTIEPIQSTSVDKKRKSIFKSDELRPALMSTLEKLYRQDPESLPFRQPTSRVYRYCTKLSEVFEQETDPVMQALGRTIQLKVNFAPHQ